MDYSGALEVLTRSNAQFPTADFDPELKDWSFVEPLIVGAGGIGCELLHLLARSGFAHLTVIDMDFIELSNLNRQFLFTQTDIGKPKSAVAAAAVMERCPNVSVTAVVGRLEDQPDSFYEAFDVVLLAVDSIPARRWINRKVAQLATHSIISATASLTPSLSSPTAGAPAAFSHGKNAAVLCSIGSYVITEAKPIIDTGTEGFEGHCRLINMQHNATPCIECEMYLYNDGAARKTVPLCTLESVPRAPEHCVLYVQMKEWPEEHRSRNSYDSTTSSSQQQRDKSNNVLDPDNAEHVRWVATRARARQEKFGIGGAPIDEMFTLGVIKNVVPAVGFTNAYVAGQAVTETLKWLTGCAPGLKNFAFYNGATETGVFADVQDCCTAPMAGGGDVNHRCLVCGPRPVVAVNAARVSPRAFLCALMELLTSDTAVQADLRSGTASLFFQSCTSAAVGAASSATVVEVALPRLTQPSSQQDQRQRLDMVRRNAALDDAVGAAAEEGSSLAAFLRSAGHVDFVHEWEAGTQMATVECFGDSETRLSALVQWGSD